MKTLTLEGDINAVDTLTRLTAQGSVSAPSRVTPSKAKKIKAIYATAGVDGAAAGSGVFLIRLGGAAVQNGEQTIVFACAGSSTVQAGADAAPIQTGLFRLENADIEVSSSEVISVSGELMGEDLGDTTVAITLVFE